MDINTVHQQQKDFWKQECQKLKDFWKQECQKLKEQNKDLEDRCESTALERDGLMDDIDTMVMEKNQLQEENKKLKEENKKIKEENEKLKAEKEGLEKYIKGMEDSQRIKDLKGEIQYLQDENEYYEEEVNEWKNACLGILEHPQDINDVDTDLVEAWIEDMKMERVKLEEKIEQIKEHVERFGSLMD
jgi:chromosome segregation ATPase